MEVPATRRLQTVAELAELPRRQQQLLWQRLHVQPRRHMVENLGTHGARQWVSNLELNFMPAAQSKVAGQYAPQLWGRQAVQMQGVKRRNQSQAQQQTPPGRTDSRRHGAFECRRGTQQKPKAKHSGQGVEQST